MCTGLEEKKKVFLTVGHKKNERKKNPTRISQTLFYLILWRIPKLHFLKCTRSLYTITPRS